MAWLDLFAPKETTMTSLDQRQPKAPATDNTQDEAPRHPQPIEPSVPEEVRPKKDPEAAPFVPPRDAHKARDVSPGMRKSPPARPRQPSIDSISRADDEGMTAPPSRPSKA